MNGGSRHCMRELCEQPRRQATNKDYVIIGTIIGTSDAIIPMPPKKTRAQRESRRL
jgi:hypothetical protein